MKSNNISLRFNNCLQAIFIIIITLFVFSLTAIDAHASVTYGPNTYASGFGFNYTGNTVLNTNGTTATGGVRLVSDKAITWDAPLIECELYWYQSSWELVAYRSLQPAIGSGKVWVGETPSIYGPSMAVLVQGEVLCYNETYTQRVQFWPAQLQGGILALASPLPTIVPLPNNGCYEINEKGDTYGSGVYARQLGYYPDLIAVRGDNGKSGFIYYFELEEINDYALRNDIPPDSMKQLLVYKDNGIDIIDTLTIS